MKKLILLFLICIPVLTYSQYNLSWINGNDSVGIRVNGTQYYNFTDDTLNAPDIDFLARNFITASETVSRTIYVSEGFGSDVTGDGEIATPYQTLDFALNSLRRNFIEADIIVQCDTGTYSISTLYEYGAFSSTLTIKGVFDTVLSGLTVVADPVDLNRKEIGSSHLADTFTGFFAQKSATDFYPIFKSYDDAVFTAKKSNPFPAITRNRTRINVAAVSGFNVIFEGENSLFSIDNADIYLTGKGTFTNKTRQEIDFCNIYTDASEDEGLELNGNVQFKQSLLHALNPTGDAIDLIGSVEGTNFASRFAILGYGNKQGTAIKCRTEKWTPAVALHIRNFDLGVEITSAGGSLELTSTAVVNRFDSINDAFNVRFGACRVRRIDAGQPIMLNDVEYIVFNQTPTILTNLSIHLPQGQFTGTPTIAPTNFTTSVILDANSYVNVEGLPLITSVDTLVINELLTYTDSVVDTIYSGTIPNLDKVNDLIAAIPEKTEFDTIRIDSVYGKDSDSTYFMSTLKLTEGIEIATTTESYAITKNLNFKTDFDIEITVTGNITINVSGIPDGVSPKLSLDYSGGDYTVTINGATQASGNTSISLQELNGAVDVIQFDKAFDANYYYIINVETP